MLTGSTGDADRNLEIPELPVATKAAD